jgi:hypothetical protein
MARFRLTEKATGLVLAVVESPTAQGAIERYLSSNPKAWLAAKDISTAIVLSDLDLACHAVLEAVEDPKCWKVDLSDSAERSKLACAIVGAIREAARQRNCVGQVLQSDPAREAFGRIIEAADRFAETWRRDRSRVLPLAG